MKLKAVFLWLGGVPSCHIATTDTGAAAASFNQVVSDGGKVKDKQFDVVELYNHGKRTRRMVFRPNSSHVIVHETVAPAADSPSGDEAPADLTKGKGTGSKESGTPKPKSKQV